MTSFVSRAVAERGRPLLSRINQPPGLWPLDVQVPRRRVPGLRDAPLGTDEGDLCLRTDGGTKPCLGTMELRSRGGEPVGEIEVRIDGQPL